MADEAETLDQTGDEQADGAAQDPTTQPVAAPVAMEGGETAEGADGWKPPQHREDGVAIDGFGFPINLRLRKAELVDAGKDEDPAGTLTAEELEAEKARLADYDETYPALRTNMKVADLVEIGEAEEVDLSTARTNDDRVALISAARPSRV